MLKKIEKYPYCASWPGAMINTHKLELPLSQTYFHGPEGARAIEVLLYIFFYKSGYFEISMFEILRNDCIWSPLTYEYQLPIS